MIFLYVIAGIIVGKFIYNWYTQRQTRYLEAEIRLLTQIAKSVEVDEKIIDDILSDAEMNERPVMQGKVEKLWKDQQKTN